MFISLSFHLFTCLLGGPRTCRYSAATLLISRVLVLIRFYIHFLQWLVPAVVPREEGLFRVLPNLEDHILMLTFSHTKSRKGCENWYERQAVQLV
jgi:hypothetical protein